MNAAENRTEIKGAGGEIILYRTKDGRTTVDVMGRIISERSITGIEADDLLRVIMDYNWSIA